MEIEQIVKLGEHLKYLVDNLSQTQIEAWKVVIASICVAGPLSVLVGIAIIGDTKVE